MAVGTTNTRTEDNDSVLLLKAMALNGSQGTMNYLVLRTLKKIKQGIRQGKVGNSGEASKMAGG